MKCIYCGCNESKVLDSRNSEEANSIRRRRECLNCGRRFTTYETVEKIPVIVIKNDGSRQPFDFEKAKTSIKKACAKRPVSEEKIEEIVSSIEKKIQSMPNQEIQSRKIGEMIMNSLEIIDDIAFVRYASVFKKFDNIQSYKDLLKNM